MTRPVADASGSVVFTHGEEVIFRPIVKRESVCSTISGKVFLIENGEASVSIEDDIGLVFGRTNGVFVIVPATVIVGANDDVGDGFTKLLLKGFERSGVVSHRSGFPESRMAIWTLAILMKGEP